MAGTLTVVTLRPPRGGGGRFYPEAGRPPLLWQTVGCGRRAPLPASPGTAQLPLHLPREAAHATPAQAGLGDGYRWARAFR